jgi:signal transduction histidine kinase
MDLFILNKDVKALESQLALQAGVDRLNTLVHLAWHLRQRDCQRALALADEAERLCVNVSADLRIYRARLLLLRAEIRLLFADFAKAEQFAHAAAQLFNELDDHLGAGDALWLDASISNDRGQLSQAMAYLDQALLEYRLAGDGLRIQIVQARRLLFSVFRDPVGTGLALQQAFPANEEYPAVLVAMVAPALALAAILTNAPSVAIKCFLDAYYAALESGQVRSALLSANNVADSFDQLGDQETALEWTERGLHLARKTAWPASIGACLLVVAGIMRKLGRYDEARACLQETLALMAEMVGSRNYLLALAALGLLELDVGNNEIGLASFVALEGHANLAPDLLVIAWRGQASALFHLGDAEQARAKALDALALAKLHDNTDMQIQCLRILAQIYAAYDLPAAEGMIAPVACLHYLNEALKVASTIGGYTIPSDLFAQIASAYAASGDFQSAYENSLAAADAHKKSHSEVAAKRALAMQISHEVERAHAETEHHRQVASALKETSATLETLGTIGREITASLNTSEVFVALHRHVHHLLDVSCFMVYLIDEQAMSLSMAFGMELGEPLPSIFIPMNHPSSNIARCARERQAILIHLEPDNEEKTLIPGTVDTRSLLYAPLIVCERLLGVMSIQTSLDHAYGERELSIFLALCAYGAIALDNSAAYAAAEASQSRADQALCELKQTQGELIQREKLASLGSLVAGVAHELNTPIGNSLLVASTLRDESQQFLQQIQQGPVRRSDLERYCKSAEESSDLLMRCLLKAADLITRFKQLAVDQTSDLRRSFDLRTECEDVALMLASRLRGAGHQLKIDIPDGLLMDSYPGAFGQVLSNLIINAIVHGLDGQEQGLISITGQAQGDQHIVLIVQDNGRGISAEHLERIFEPFFTTRLGQGGSGLGMHISYNIVSSVLGGSIGVSSPDGEGARFEMILPRYAG